MALKFLQVCLLWWMARRVGIQFRRTRREVGIPNDGRSARVVNWSSHEDWERRERNLTWAFLLFQQAIETDQKLRQLSQAAFQNS